MATVLPRAFQKNCPARRSALSHGTKNPEELDSACAVIPSIWAAFQPAAPVYTSKQLMSRGFAAVPILRANGHSIDLAGNMPACWSTAAPVTISRFDSEFRFALGTESAYGNLTKKKLSEPRLFGGILPQERSEYLRCSPQASVQCSSYTMHTTQVETKVHLEKANMYKKLPACI